MNTNGTEASRSDLNGLLAGAKTQADKDNLTVAFRHFAQTHPDSFAGELAVLLQAHANTVHAAADRQAAATQANPEIVDAIKSLEKRLQRPAVLIDPYESGWTKAARFGLRFCLAPILAAFGAWWLTSDHYRQEADAHSQTPEALIWQNLEAMHARLSCSLSPDQRLLTLRVLPAADPQAWHLIGKDSITLSAPSATASAGR